MVLHSSCPPSQVARRLPWRWPIPIDQCFDGERSYRGIRRRRLDIRSESSPSFARRILRCAAPPDDHLYSPCDGGDRAQVPFLNFTTGCPILPDSTTDCV